MLEGNVVENTPGEWLRQIEDWVTAYPEERRGVANALTDASDRLRETGLHLNPLTWAMIGEPQPRRWLIDRWLPAGSVALLTGEGGAGKSRLALQLAAGIASNRSSPEAWSEGEAAPRLGKAVPDGGTAVVYATWEDRADEMARRLSQISGGPAPWCQPSSLDNLKMLDLAGYGPLWTAATRYDAPSLTPLGRGIAAGGGRRERRPAGTGFTGRRLWGERERPRAGEGFHGVVGRLGYCRRLHRSDHWPSAQIRRGILGIH